MKIIDEEGCYWTENSNMGFWSSYNQLDKDERDFNIIKALILVLSMRLFGIKARLIKQKIEDKK